MILWHKIPFLVVSLLIIACTEERSPETLPPIVVPPDHESIHPFIALYDTANLQATITAGRARVYFQFQKTILDSGVHIFFYSPAGKPYSQIRSDSIVIDDQTHHIMASGNVIAESDSPRTLLRSDHLYWDNTARSLYTPDSVYLETEKEKIWGSGFQSDERLQNYSFQRVKLLIHKGETAWE